MKDLKKMIECAEMYALKCISLEDVCFLLECKEEDIPSGFFSYADFFGMKYDNYLKEKKEKEEKEAKKEYPDLEEFFDAIILEDKFDHLYQGKTIKIGDCDKEFGFNGGYLSIDHCDVYLFWYKDYFFLTNEDCIMFFHQERLMDYITGVLDEFWGLYPTNYYGPIILENTLFHHHKYAFSKDAFEALWKAVNAKKLQKIVDGNNNK